MDSQRISARWAFVLLASLALGAGCGDSNTGNVVDEEENGDDNGSSGKTPTGNNPTGNNTSTNPTEPGNNDPQPGEETTTPGQDLGQGDGKDVVAIGDSYMRIPNQLQKPGNEGVDLSLNKASGRTYRSFAFTGSSLLPPVAVAMKNGVIPKQYENAKKEGDVKTLLVTGGGNDMPQGGGACKGAKTSAEINAECKSLVVSINEAIDKFIADVAKQGVKDVIWVGYGPTDPAKGLEGAIAALREDRKAKCVADNPALGLRCHYIDNAAAGIPTRDGFHPTPEGYDAVGKAVWERMKKEGVRR